MSRLLDLAKVPVLKRGFCIVRCHAKVVLVRHADVPSGGGADPSLTAQGHARAVALCTLLGSAGVSKIIVSSFQRTQQTAQPTATLLGLTPQVITEPPAILTAIRALPRTATVLVVGHTNTVPDVITGLGGPAVVIGAGEFDRLFVVVNGQLVELRYGD